MTYPWLSAPSMAPAPVAVLAWLAATAAAALLGWMACGLLGLGWLSRGRRLLVALGLGYVLLAYVILALGLAGRLSMAAMLVVAPVGAAALLCRPLRAAAGDGPRRAASACLRSPWRWLYLWLATWAVVTALGALGPSDARDWDGLSEHLAQAKAYLHHGRIGPLWYDHHSEFPNTTVMLYCVGLALGGQGAAKLFHWAFAVLSVLAVWLLARRHTGPASAAPAAWALASMPTMGWLAAVAYVDLGAVLFCVLAVDALLRWREEGADRELYLAALMAGCGMTVKMQGVFAFGILGLAVLFWAWRLRRRAAPVVLAVLIGAAVAAPWYAKSWAFTGNPVYPFAYGLFGGKQWSAQQAAPYAYDQARFGWGAMPAADEWGRMSGLRKHLAGPRSPLSMLLAPFTLTLMPEYYHVMQPRMTAMALYSIGPLFLGLAPLLWLLPGPKPRAAAWLAWLFAAFWLLWLQTTQVSRYLLPALALLAPVVGLSVREWSRRGALPRRVIGATAVVWSLLALGFLAMQVVPIAPAALGLASPETCLAANLDVYPPLAFINRYTEPGAKIGTYGEPRLFYLDRDGMWADPGHSQLVDYAGATTPERLVAEFRRLGLTHILINQAFFGALGKSQERVHQLLLGALDRGLLEPVPMPGVSAAFLLAKVSGP